MALVVLWVFGLASCTPSMESDLTDRAVAALASASAGLDGVTVDFDGRDAVLGGSADPAQRALATRIVEGLTGVRRVDVDASDSRPMTSDSR